MYGGAKFRILYYSGSFDLIKTYTAFFFNYMGHLAVPAWNYPPSKPLSIS